VKTLEVDGLYSEIGRRIKAEREALGFTQIDLAQEIGLTRTSLTNIEAGRQRLPIHVLYAIASALALPVSDLLPK
jgi:transcriptional regulator with XRE-family HTH domain